jgi:hypothetical protein
MNEASTTATSNDSISEHLREMHGVKNRLAFAEFVFNLAFATAATACGVRRCFVEQSGATPELRSAFVRSDTQPRELKSEMKAELHAILDAARDDIIADGMPNTVTERLPDLVVSEFDVFLPAIVSAIETGRATPIVSAEVLKVLGRIRNPASHASRRWVLERALDLHSPFIRDGAGLGLARLADPSAIPYLRRAVENELNAQTRADLQLVVDELSENDGAPIPHSD